MFYVSFFIIFITLFHLNESVYIKVDTKNPNIIMDPILRRYLNTITQLSERFPGRAIEVQLQFEVPKRNAVPIPSTIRRHNVRSNNAPRVIKMLRSSDAESPSSTDTTPTTTVTTATETSPTTVTSAPIQTLNNKEDPDNVPIYLDDLKKAIEEFENKALHSGCDGHSEGHAESSTSSSSYSAKRRIRDIMQLIEKGIDVEFNVPRPAQNGLNWLQVKLPGVL